MIWQFWTVPFTREEVYCMQEFERAIASYCKQLRLSSGLAERAMLITGESHQDFLCNLLKSEVEYRKAARIEN